MVHLGALESVDIRKVWQNEAHDFTPWLAENLERLSQVIGVPMEFKDSEVQVEQFSADILARNPIDDSLVLIENQLGLTEHTHLGQILTYLAGLEAQTVIWVAQDFHEAHLSAIRWLNEHTTDPFAFFAVRVRVVRIGDSPMAPVFEVAERPIEWDRRVRAIGGLTKLGEFRRAFWLYYAERYPDDSVRRGHAGGYVRHKIEGMELTVSQYLAQREVGIFLPGGSWEQVKRYENSLKTKLGVELGGPDSDYLALNSLTIDSANRENWQRMADWLHENLCAYRGVLTENISDQQA